MPQIKKPPLRVANAVSILIDSGQDTDRLDEKNSEVAEAGTRFRCSQRLGFPPFVPTSSYDGLPDFFVHSIKLPYLMSLSSVVRHCKIKKNEQE